MTMLLTSEREKYDSFIESKRGIARETEKRARTHRHTHTSQHFINGSCFLRAYIRFVIVPIERKYIR